MFDESCAQCFGVLVIADILVVGNASKFRKLRKREDRSLNEVNPVVGIVTVH